MERFQTLKHLLFQIIQLTQIVLILHWRLVISLSQKRPSYLSIFRNLSRAIKSSMLGLEDIQEEHISVLDDQKSLELNVLQKRAVVIADIVLQSKKIVMDLNRIVAIRIKYTKWMNVILAMRALKCRYSKLQSNRFCGNIVFVDDDRGDRVARLVATLPLSNCKEWIPSSRNPATVHWTVALNGSSLNATRGKNKREAKASLLCLVRVARLELAASWSQTRRPTNWATPGNIQLFCTDIRTVLYTNLRKNATVNFL